ncbi:MAG: hypothetical protein FWC19_05685 [Treponema sp.]|nr:hypothetical protein [Treponema sp.]MCL2272279.1 hypothetical protein [Treponema sp.]
MGKKTVNIKITAKLQFFFIRAEGLSVPPFIAGLFVSFFLMFSCATNQAFYTSTDAAVFDLNFDKAIDIIIKGQREKNAVYPEKNAVSLYLDKGLLEHYAGNYETSSNDLQFAERLIEEAYTKSITEEFFSYIVNDNIKNYPGEDFEDIYLNIFNALNYYHRGSMEGALVEIRKLSSSGGKLVMLAKKYEYTDPKSGENFYDIVQRETGLSTLPETFSVNFSNSALARFLGALFYQASGNHDAARLEFNQVQRAFSTNRNIYRNPLPAAVEESRNVPPGKARLNVLCFTGLSPIKHENVLPHFLPFHHPVLQVGFFKIPVLKNRNSIITRIEVIVNENRFKLELLEDISAVIEETFKARYSNILAKTYIRTFLKYAASDIAAIETSRKNGRDAGFLAAFAARIIMDSSESADTRMSRYLPGRSHIGGINLDPGTYDVYINYYHINELVSGEEYKNVIVKETGLNLLQSVNLK